MSSEKFCLKWNDFQTNVANTFRKLRTTDHFFDVTLVSDDQTQVLAHKVVLSSSSEYFKNILTSNNHSHPMLCLNGVNTVDLKSMLDFIYNGEIQIYQDNLDNFLDIAQRFQLEGLLNGKDETNDTLHENERYEEKISASEDDKMIAVHENKYAVAKPPREKISSIVSANFENVEELDQKIEDMMEKLMPNGMWLCTTCGKETKKKDHMREHVELHIDGLSFPCQYCDKSFRSRQNLRVHVNRCRQYIVNY